jgi:TPR repeat protein
MSVQEWLERSADRNARAGDDDAERGSRRRSRMVRSERDESPLDSLSRRYGRRAFREEALSEDRVTRILDDAMDVMQDTIRANEAKTASVIAALGEQLDQQARSSTSVQQVNTVQRMVSDIENGLNVPDGKAARSVVDASAIDLLEQRISNVVSLLEKKSRSTGFEGQKPDLSLDKRRPMLRLEHNVAALGERLEQFSRQLTTRPQSLAQQDVSQHLSKLHDEIARLGKIAQAPAANPNIMSVLEQLNARLGQMEQSTRSQPLDRVTQEIAALRAGLHAARETSAPDLSLIEQRFEMLKRQLEQVVDRIGQIDRTPANTPSVDRFVEEVASLRAGLQMIRMQSEPDLSGVERRFDSLNGRIDQLADKISSLKFGAPRDLRSQRSFDTAIAELKSLMERNTTSSNDGQLLGAVQSLEQRLDAVVRAASHKEPMPGVAALEQQMGSLKSRLDDIADKMAERRFADDVGGSNITQIGQAIEDLKHLIQTGSRSGDDARVVEAFQAIERRMESLERTPSELVARVDQLQAMLASRPAISPQVSPDTEQLLRKLAAQIDRLEGGAGDDRAFDRLHQDIRAISDRLNMPVAPGGDANGFAEISQLERSVSMLIGELEALKSNMGTTAERAARLAATDVLQQNPVKAVGDSLGENLQVQRQLSDMHVAQQEADKRTTETLGAVHSALTQVVTRLVDMEKEMAKRQELPAPRSIAPEPQAFQIPMMPPPVASLHSPSTTTLPPPVTAPMQAVSADAPPVRINRANPLPQLDAGPPVLPQRQSEALEMPLVPPLASEALSATVADARAQKLGVSAPVAVTASAPASPIAGALASAKGLLAGLRPSKGKAAPDISVAVPATPAPRDALTAPVAPPVSAPAAPAFDMPLEPGSGRPRPGAAQRPAAMADANDPKANFLAAARRAAQVAADQSATAMAQGTAVATEGKKTAKAGLKKKHALLLGLAALIVAVGATLTFMKDAPPTKSDAPAVTSSVAPINREATSRRVETAQPANPAPRQILPQSVEPNAGAAQPRMDERASSLPTRAAQPGAAFLPPDMATVGSISAEPARPAVPSMAAPVVAPPRVPATANDQLLRFEGVNGSERLKEAARNGDTSAFIELGNRYLEGKGAPRDPKTAALWYERAADFGSAPAQYRLGALYREGRGVERNAKMALKHFQSAAEAGNARAMHNTAVLMAEGVNGGPDYAGATDWFKKAAEFGIRDSQYNLAILYARGLGVSQDLMASYAWFAAAAASGDEDAGKKRDEVGARLPADRLQQAKAAAQIWRPKTPDPLANEVGVPAGGWDTSARQVPNAARPPAGQKRI